MCKTKLISYEYMPTTEYTPHRTRPPRRIECVQNVKLLLDSNVFLIYFRVASDVHTV